MLIPFFSTTGVVVDVEATGEPDEGDVEELRAAAAMFCSHALWSGGEEATSAVASKHAPRGLCRQERTL